MGPLYPAGKQQHAPMSSDPAGHAHPCQGRTDYLSAPHGRGTVRWESVPGRTRRLRGAHATVCLLEGVSKGGRQLAVHRYSAGEPVSRLGAGPLLKPVPDWPGLAVRLR